MFYWTPLPFKGKLQIFFFYPKFHVAFFIQYVREKIFWNWSGLCLESHWCFVSNDVQMLHSHAHVPVLSVQNDLAHDVKESDRNNNQHLRFTHSGTKTSEETLIWSFISLFCSETDIQVSWGKKLLIITVCNLRVQISTVKTASVCACRFEWMLSERNKLTCMYVCHWCHEKSCVFLPCITPHMSGLHGIYKFWSAKGSVFIWPKILPFY